VDCNFAKKAIGWLERRDRTKPFCLAVGFHRPHLPFVAPAKYFDLYPFETITLPPEPVNDEADIPAPARNEAVDQYAMTATPDQRRAAIRAYLATVSYMDAQAGRVLEALKRLGLADNTIVIFSCDHGWHLGEHGLWHKRSLFEQSARVPFIIRTPRAKGNGLASKSLVELLDIYPRRVIWLASRRRRYCRVEVYAHYWRIRRRRSTTQARRGPESKNWGRSVRTLRWRCTEWDEGSNGIELYYHDANPGEFTNLANEAQHSGVLKELRALLADRLPQPN
jgi:hypothetical protein